MADREQTSGELGYVHSHDTASAVDGPGLRYVVWLRGCHLRCQYCHNPDMLALPPHGGGVRAAEVLAGIAGYAAFLRSAGGGFTVSGGEPLVQAPFAMELLRGARDLGLHTALDTNGYLGEKLTDDDLRDIDLVLLDLKAFGEAQHRRVTGVANKAILAFAERLGALRRPTWVRFVLVPELTDEPADLGKLADFVSRLPNVERIEVLPFHQMGAAKWDRLGMAYPLKGKPTATKRQAEAVRAVFRDAGCRVV